MPKPEEVPKKPKFWRSPGPKTSGTSVFLETSSGFGKKGFGFFGTPSGFGKKGFGFLVSPLRFWHDFIAKTCGKETPSKNERNPGMKDFSLISNEIFRRIHMKENPSRNEKSRNDGFLLENPSKNEKSMNEGFVFNF